MQLLFLDSIKSAEVASTCILCGVRWTRTCTSALPWDAQTWQPLFFGVMHGSLTFDSPSLSSHPLRPSSRHSRNEAFRRRWSTSWVNYWELLGGNFRLPRTNYSSKAAVIHVLAQATHQPKSRPIPHARPEWKVPSACSYTQPPALRPPQCRVSVSPHHALEANPLAGPTSELLAALPFKPQKRMLSTSGLRTFIITLGETAAASLDVNFTEELSAIERFKILSDAGRTAALYSLLQHSTQMQIRFITVLNRWPGPTP
ncbi:hypothetical protein EDB89DRAFT_879451 [Lactarius sanguifluus]|nr:hypothetical protein EDB89DRAFT_879451 [Lactarius sanguifluus]